MWTRKYLNELRAKYRDMLPKIAKIFLIPIFTSAFIVFRNVKGLAKFSNSVKSNKAIQK